MERRYGLYSQSSELWSSFRNGDFEEEDVWTVLKETIQDNSIESFNSSSRKNHPSASRLIPRETKSNGNSTSSYNSINESRLTHQSAPMNIPQWSKIYDKKSKEVSWHGHEIEDDDGDDDDVQHQRKIDNEGVDDDDDEGEEYENEIPPHEYIARRLARSQISSFSVFEGVGRTLKGRDLSEVRDAVLTKTGFLESF